MTDFIAFASQYGLRIKHLIPDGRWKRVATEDHPRKKNGAYVLLGDRGAVRNWATMQDYALYRGDKTDAPPVDREYVRKLMAKAIADERKRHQDAERAAADMLKRAKLIRPKPATKWVDGVYTHKYLEDKGFKDAECLVLDDKLLIPMRDCLTQKLVGMQTIAADGTKLFIPGTRAKGAVFRLGRASELWLCEGVATAYSVQAGLKALYREASVLVCFSAGNLVTVAGMLADQRVFVAADNDASLAGQNAAQATAKPWVMPDEVGTDFNDLHAAGGVKAVRDVLRRIV